ncbi:MAG: acetylglutamate kinase, partial [Spirochaetales bacterium]
MELCNMKQVVVIKIGGKAAQPETIRNLAKDMKSLESVYSFILVHGGGAEVTTLAGRLGLKSVFKDGIRMTGREEMDVVDMVLSGKMNKQIVRLFNTLLKAAGLTGSDGLLFMGESLEGQGEDATRTGRITEVNPDILNLLLDNGYTPVVASTSMDKTGRALNINADEAALHLATALKAFRLIYISDIPGILKNNAVMRRITREEAEQEIKAGVINGGMIPKITSSLEALSRGVGGIV